MTDTNKMTAAPETKTQSSPAKLIGLDGYHHDVVPEAPERPVITLKDEQGVCLNPFVA